mgnify:CR=1 FL=1|tara:strand:+ start:533 stop:760 length:228 start_codon:yes stop_codon:yes gene_type:complete
MNMLQKFFWGFVVLVFALFGVVFSEGSDIKTKSAVLEYQNDIIQETLNLHTKKLDILTGSQYELHSKLDKIIGEK